MGASTTCVLLLLSLVGDDRKQSLVKNRKEVDIVEYERQLLNGFTRPVEDEEDAYNARRAFAKYVPTYARMCQGRPRLDVRDFYITFLKH